MEENRVINSDEILEEDKDQKESLPKNEELPKRTIKFEDGTIISNLKITYKNLFDFQNSYSGAKDLMAAVIKKQTFEQEVMIQLIYVGYLGTNPNPKLDYIDFIDALEFDYKRDMNLFRDLTGLTASKN